MSKRLIVIHIDHTTVSLHSRKEFYYAITTIPEPDTLSRLQLQPPQEHLQLLCNNFSTHQPHRTHLKLVIIPLRNLIAFAVLTET